VAHGVIIMQKARVSAVNASNKDEQGRKEQRDAEHANEEGDVWLRQTI
jgi:hypothetical protein